MTLLENYLAEVSSYLPIAVSARNDIVDELREELISSAESQKPVSDFSDHDWSALLLKFGHPAKVAAKYMGTRPLVSEEFTGFFFVALKPMAYVIIGLYVLIAVFRILGGQSTWQAIPQMVSQIVEGFIFVTGCALIVLSLLSHFNIKAELFKNWQPGKLRNRGPKDAVSRGESIFEVLVSSIFVAWWLELIQFSTLYTGDSTSHYFALSSAWQPYYYAIAALSIAEIARASYHVFYPFRNYVSASVRVLLNAASLFIIAMLLGAQELVVFNAPDSSADALVKVQNGVGFAVRTLLYGIALVQTLEILSDLKWAWQKRTSH